MLFVFVIFFSYQPTDFTQSIMLIALARGSHAIVPVPVKLPWKIYMYVGHWHYFKKHEITTTEKNSTISAFREIGCILCATKQRDKPSREGKTGNQTYGFHGWLHLFVRSWSSDQYHMMLSSHRSPVDSIDEGLVMPWFFVFLAWKGCRINSRFVDGLRRHYVHVTAL